MAWRTKTNHDLAVPMMPEVEHALRVLWEMSPGDTSNYLFPRYALGKSDRAMYRMLKDLVIRSGQQPWPKLTNNLRISWGQDLKLAGVPASTIAKWLDHSEEVHEDHYEIIDASEFEAASKIDSGLFTQQDATPPLEGKKPKTFKMQPEDISEDI